MPKMTSRQLEELQKQSQARARAEIAKSKIMHFRIDSRSILQIYAVAEKQRKNPGAMVLEWVLERLRAETGKGPTLEQRIEALEKITAKRSRKR